jgi:hypothetical protein
MSGWTTDQTGQSRNPGPEIRMTYTPLRRVCHARLAGLRAFFKEFYGEEWVYRLSRDLQVPASVVRHQLSPVWRDVRDGRATDDEHVRLVQVGQLEDLAYANGWNASVFDGVIIAKPRPVRTTGRQKPVLS